MEKAREYPVYICFVDLCKTYNSVNRSTLWSVSNIATICHQSFSPSSKPCMRTPLLLWDPMARYMISFWYQLVSNRVVCWHQHCSTSSLMLRSGLPSATMTQVQVWVWACPIRMFTWIVEHGIVPLLVPGHHKCSPQLVSMEWYPSLFVEFVYQLIFPCRHTCSSETCGTIPTSLLVCR